ncbi:right-handed parallel beta-helix repeat-containing protein, partial [Hydrogenobaculum acidophilum]
CIVINSKVHDGVNNNGVHVFSSETSIKSCEIFKNYYQGIYVTEKSKFSIEGCDIYGNGNEKGNYPQVHINKSNGSIIDSKIHDGVDYGIVIVLTPKSPITLTKVSTWNNKTGLKYDYGGDVVIKDCDFKDGSGSLGFFENFKY